MAVERLHHRMGHTPNRLWNLWPALYSNTSQLSSRYNIISIQWTMSRCLLMSEIFFNTISIQYIWGTRSVWDRNCCVMQIAPQKHSSKRRIESENTTLLLSFRVNRALVCALHTLSQIQLSLFVSQSHGETSISGPTCLVSDRGGGEWRHRAAGEAERSLDQGTGLLTLTQYTHMDVPRCCSLWVLIQSKLCVCLREQWYGYTVAMAYLFPLSFTAGLYHHSQAPGLQGSWSWLVFNLTRILFEVYLTPFSWLGIWRS